MTNQEQKNWKRKSTAELFIAKECFHHYAKEIVKQNDDVFKKIRLGLNGEINISTTIRKNNEILSKGIKAKSLNEEIRNLLSNSNHEIHLEVEEEKGVFYFSKKNKIGGFDFALINDKSNLIALRNICFGELRYHDGQKRWNKFLRENDRLKKMANKIKEKEVEGVNIRIEENRENINSPLIVGEIQFGNWALSYRDFFKVLKANVANNIDCLVYVVSCNNLEKYLSSGIVTFDKTVKIIEDFAKVIDIPIWLIGLDIKNEK